MPGDAPDPPPNVAPGTAEFDAALDALAGGAPLWFEGVRFMLSDVSIEHLRCEVRSRWSWADITEERVLEEFARGRAALQALRDASPRFVALAGERIVSVELMDDEWRYLVAIDTEHGVKWV